MVVVLGIVFAVYNDLVSLDDLLVGVHDPGVMVADGDPELLDVDVHHAVSRCQDVNVRDGGAATEMCETRNSIIQCQTD